MEKLITPILCLLTTLLVSLVMADKKGKHAGSDSFRARIALGLSIFYSLMALLSLALTSGMVSLAIYNQGKVWLLYGLIFLFLLAFAVFVFISRIHWKRWKELRK